MPPPPSATDALSAAATLGGFFDTRAEAGPGAVTWAQVLTDPGVLGGRLDEVRARLAAGSGADPPVRVVASLIHLGLVARLVSPALGAALLTGVLPVVPAGGVVLRLRGGDPLPLAVFPPSVRDATDPAVLAAAFDETWLVPLIAPLSAALRRDASVSPRVLTGNVTSAVAGALQVAATQRPDLAGRSAAVLTALLGTGSLAGTGQRQGDGAFVRRSCCLLYRLPGTGTCGDCILRHAGPAALRAGRRAGD